MIFDQVEAFLSLLDRFKKWRRERRTQNNELVATRFVRIFESHGVHRNQIPRYFGHSISLADLKDDDSLLEKLDEAALNAACSHFAVRREWLDGADQQPHERHDFYKHPEDFAEFIRMLKEANPTGEFSGVLIAPIDGSHDAEALLILQESIGHVGEKVIYRYHLCNDWTFSYWKSRAYLTACVAIAWKNRIYVHGTYSPEAAIEELASGKTLLGWNGEGVWSFGVKRWDPEDMALRPDAFLNGIDPERRNFGIQAGLRHWLDLDERGFMKTGLNKDCRSLFEQELLKYGPEPKRLFF